MKDNYFTILKIDEALKGLELRIDAVHRQKVTNAGLLFAFKDDFLRLKDMLIQDKTIDQVFVKNWNLHLAFVSRFFEADPLGNLIFEIDKLLFKK